MYKQPKKNNKVFPATLVFLTLLLAGYAPLFSQQMDTIIVPKMEHKSNLFGVSYLSQGAKIHGIGNKNFGIQLMYGYSPVNPQKPTTNWLESKIYFTAKAGYLRQKFDGGAQNSDHAISLGVLMQEPQFGQSERFGLQFGVDIGLLNRGASIHGGGKTAYQAALNGGLIFNIYGGLGVSVDIRLLNNKWDYTYAGFAGNLTYKF